ncbi:response regulator [Rhizobium sp. TH2]|uniref:response regulator n=1 Tax=Rhizobium sp. TH2 TaxID=2775403 RepID=UPI0021589EA8|nr:response regulator [Rhizobium sp. TH2]UVC09783.1 response regulator [Rhizobium sp. TH2]
MAGPTTILIIDDSEDDREVFRRMLTRGTSVPYRVLEAATGEEGIVLCRDQLPDCILLDYSLPGRNGVAVLEEIRKFNPFVAAIMLTGQGNEMVAVDVMKAGAQDYFVKDAISQHELERAIAHAITQQDLASKLEQQRQSLEIFTRAMAHDLKEPLRTIKSFGKIIQGSADLLPENGELMDYVLKAADNMESLINSISRYTRLESQGRIQPRDVSLIDVLKQVRTNLSQQIESRDAIVIEHDLGTMAGDALLIAQLLQNLISNAIHYCRDVPPRVTVSMERVDGALRLTVADNGPGIAPEYREVIFKPFRRLVGREVEGSGLGLAICRRIAELHGATIHCEDAPGGGTAFVTAFPAQAEPERVDHATGAGTIIGAQETSALRAGGRMADVLLVEDSPADVHLTRIKLMEMEKVHFHLHVSTNGKEALSWLESRLAERGGLPVDLVLLDINMPLMDGFQVLDNLGADPRFRAIPVCMLSTSSDENDLRRAHDHGARGYMVKPASRQQLTEALEKIGNLRLVEDQGVTTLVA